MSCELCERDISLTKHHLIPRKHHNNKWVNKHLKDRKYDKIKICRDCHDAVHHFIDEKTLAKEYNTKEKLMEHSDIKNFVEWVGKSDKRTFKF